MHHLITYVPASHRESLKQALFAAGAGRIGQYDQCCWEVAGQGQYRPLAGSQPFLGEQDRVETVAEYKLELVVDDARVSAVIAALRAAHPYEEPAFACWPVRTA